MRKPIEKYTALVMQPHVEVATDRDGIARNLQRAIDLIDYGVGYFWEVPVRLVVFPEYFLQGVTTPGKGEHGLEDFMKKAITFDDPEIQALIKSVRNIISIFPVAALLRKCRSSRIAGSIPPLSWGRAVLSYAITNITSPPLSAWERLHMICGMNTQNYSAAISRIFSRS